MRIAFAETLRFPTQGSSASGESGLRRGRKAYPMDNGLIVPYRGQGAKRGRRAEGQPADGRSVRKRAFGRKWLGVSAKKSRAGDEVVVPVPQTDTGREVE